ncbi:lasso peptide biosynthesis protein [Sorangium sp. So ce385]|uniref:lasso peptide biosynthesis protein n=1 Tax=Sorangium sp. So ce385 TaxID=3133308 RepID=UPI003F5BAA58
MQDHQHRNVTANVFRELCRFMSIWEVDGGCHLLSMMAYVLLKEVGVDATLNAGWARSPRLAFTHSWIEVDGRPFDIAIARPNLHRLEYRCPAVVYGIEIGSRNPTRIEYGVSGPALDRDTSMIATGTVGSWADRAPIPDWPWDRIVEVGSQIGLTLSRTGLRTAHANSPWTLRQP